MITSTSNQQMKNVSALLKKSKERRNSKTFVVEGPRMVVEAPVKSIKAVYVAENFENNKESITRKMRKFKNCIRKGY